MDLGSHIVSLARHLVGPIEEVSAATGDGAQEPRRRRTGRKPVATDDHSHFLARFANGALGDFTASWVTPGRKMQLEFELIGTRGSLVFSAGALQRAASLHRPTTREARRLQDAARRPGHAALRKFLPGARPSARLQRSEDDRGRASDQRDRRRRRRPSPDFSRAYEIQRVVAASLRSASERAWVRVDSL